MCTSDSLFDVNYEVSLMVFHLNFVVVVLLSFPLCQRLFDRQLINYSSLFTEAESVYCWVVDVLIQSFLTSNRVQRSLFRDSTNRGIAAKEERGIAQTRPVEMFKHKSFMYEWPRAILRATKQSDSIAPKSKSIGNSYEHYRLFYCVWFSDLRPMKKKNFYL